MMQAGDTQAVALPRLNATTRVYTPSGTTQAGRARLLATGGALAIHALALAMIARVVVAPLVSPPSPPGFAMVMTEVTPLAASPLRTQSAEPPSLAAVAPLTIRSNPAPPAAAPVRQPRPAAIAAPRLAARAAPAAAPQAAPAPAPPIDTDALLPGLEGRIDAAVQRAAVLPAAAQRQHREGRARLRFTYVDGAVQDVRVVSSSSSRILDDAAMAAVRNANVPAPPAALRGRRLDLLVWVIFRLAADSDG